MKAFAPIFFALCVSSALAALAGPGGPTLAIRQVAPPSNAECKSSCSAIGDSLDTCEAAHGDEDQFAQCSCSDNISSQWQTCFDCAVSHGLDKASAQSGIDAIVDACQASGTPFKTPPTLSASGSGNSGSSKNSGVASFGTKYAVGIAVVLSGLSSVFLYA